MGQVSLFAILRRSVSLSTVSSAPTVNCTSSVATLDVSRSDDLGALICLPGRSYHRYSESPEPTAPRSSHHIHNPISCHSAAALLISFSIDHILWWFLQCRRPEETILRIWNTQKTWQTVLCIRNFASRYEDCPVWCDLAW